jgi:type II secretory pathway pseudopilin PulG
LKTRRHNGAFTIVELLIAATITVLIVVMLGTMFGNLGKTATRANQRTDAFRDARAALHMIARDFSCLVIAKPAAYFASNPDQSNTSGSQARQLLGLISTKNKPTPSSIVAGDLCAVGYYCSWDNTNKQFKLLRFFNDSEATRNVFKTFLKSSTTLDYVGVSDLYPMTGNEEVVATNCWNLLVTAFDDSGNIIQSVALPDGRQTSRSYICDPDSATTNALPAAIEVSFKAMSSDAARIAAASGADPSVWMAYDSTGGDKGKYDRLIRPNVYEFRTRIPLK